MTKNERIMKNIYFILVCLSIMGMGGDSDSFLAFIIWHVACIGVLMVSLRQIDRLEENE